MKPGKNRRILGGFVAFCYGMVVVMIVGYGGDAISAPAANMRSVWMIVQSMLIGLPFVGYAQPDLFLRPLERLWARLRGN